MDRATIEQLDRIEATVRATHQNSVEALHFNVVDCVVQFYDNEVVDKEGKLHHLVSDEKFKAFIDELREDEEDNSEAEEGTQEEYSQP